MILTKYILPVVFSAGAISGYSGEMNKNDSGNRIGNDNEMVVVDKDNIKPNIKLNGKSVIVVKGDEKYNDKGAIANDNIDGDITEKIIVIDNINYSKFGEYYIKYSVTDSSGNTNSIKRTIIVSKRRTSRHHGNSGGSYDYSDTVKPLITLNGSENITIEKDSVYTDYGATASDNIDGNITSNIIINNNVNTSIVGVYLVTYDVVDSSGNVADEVTRTVNVVDNNNSEYINEIDMHKMLNQDLYALNKVGITGYGANESIMDSSKMSLSDLDSKKIITAIPEFENITNIDSVHEICEDIPNNLFANTESGSLAYNKNNEICVFSGLENKWVKGFYTYDHEEYKRYLNDDDVDWPNQYILWQPIRDINFELRNGGILYYPKGLYYAGYTGSVHADRPNYRMKNVRIIGDGVDKTIIDSSKYDDVTGFEINFGTIYSVTGIENFIVEKMTFIDDKRAVKVSSVGKADFNNIIFRDIDIKAEGSSPGSQTLAINISTLLDVNHLTIENVNLENYDGESLRMHGLTVKGKSVLIKDVNIAVNTTEFSIDSYSDFIEFNNVNFRGSGVSNMKFPNASHAVFYNCHFDYDTNNTPFNYYRNSNFLHSSSLDSVKLYFENCTFDHEKDQWFGNYGVTPYPIDELTLINNTFSHNTNTYKDIGIDSANKVYMKNNTFIGENSRKVGLDTNNHNWVVEHNNFSEINKIETLYTDKETSDENLSVNEKVVISDNDTPFNKKMGYKYWISEPIVDNLTSGVYMLDFPLNIDFADNNILILSKNDFIEAINNNEKRIVISRDYNDDTNIDLQDIVLQDIVFINMSDNNIKIVGTPQIEGDVRFINFDLESGVDIKEDAKFYLISGKISGNIILNNNVVYSQLNSEWNAEFETKANAKARLIEFNGSNSIKHAIKIDKDNGISSKFFVLTNSDFGELRSEDNAGISIKNGVDNILIYNVTGLYPKNIIKFESWDDIKNIIIDNLNYKSLNGENDAISRIINSESSNIDSDIDTISVRIIKLNGDTVSGIGITTPHANYACYSSNITLSGGANDGGSACSGQYYSHNTKLNFWREYYKEFKNIIIPSW